MTLLSTLLVIAAGLSLAVMVVLLTLAAHSARESRSTIFPIVREEELSRTRRARVGGVFAGVIATVLAGAFFAAGQLPEAGPMVVGTDRATDAELALADNAGATDSVEQVKVDETSVPAVPTVVSPEKNPTGESEPAHTALPPTATATEMMPSPTLPVTDTPSPASTPTPVPPSPTPPGTPTPAPEGVAMGPITFATEIDARRNPVTPASIFSEGLDRIYAVFPYNGMQKGLAWTQVWYFNGVEFTRDEASWEWGQADRSYVFIRPVGAGDYRLELFINDELMSSAEFTVLGPTAIGGPEETETP